MVNINQDIAKACHLLESGEVVAIPTETVYGLAANAFNEQAVFKIFDVKERPFFDPLIVHVQNIHEAERCVSSFPEKARQLARRFWPGPLTLILPKSDRIPDLVTSGLPYVGVRVPRHPLTLELLSMLPFPLAAPSANPFGYVSPTSADHVASQLGHKIPFILDGGPCEVGLESTIVMFEKEDPVVLRLGGLDIMEIEDEIGPVTIQIATHSKPNAPGQLDKHYATRTPIRYREEVDLSSINPERTGALVFNCPIQGIPLSHQEILAPDGSIQAAAQHLFAAMRKLDKLDFDLIITEDFPEVGLGKAINDRIRRAKG